MLYVFWFDENLNIGFLADSLWEIFQTLHDYDLVWSLPVIPGLMTLTYFQVTGVSES